MRKVLTRTMIMVSFGCMCTLSDLSPAEKAYVSYNDGNKVKLGVFDSNGITSIQDLGANGHVDQLVLRPDNSAYVGYIEGNDNRGKLGLLNETTLTPIQDFGANGSVDQLVLRPDNSAYVGYSDGNGAKLGVFDGNSITSIQDFGVMSGVYRLVLRPDNNSAYVGYRDDGIAKLGIFDGNTITSIQDFGANGAPYQLAVRPDNSAYVAYYDHGIAKLGIFNGTTLTPAAQDFGANGAAYQLAVRPDNSAYVAYKDHGIAKLGIFNGTTLTPAAQDLGANGYVSRLVLRPDNNSVYVGYKDGNDNKTKLGVFDGNSITSIQDLGANGYVYQLVLRPDNKAYVGYRDGNGAKLGVFDGNSITSIQDLRVNGSVYQLALRPDNSVYVGYRDGNGAKLGVFDGNSITSIQDLGTGFVSQLVAISTLDPKPIYIPAIAPAPEVVPALGIPISSPVPAPTAVPIAAPLQTLTMPALAPAPTAPEVVPALGVPVSPMAAPTAVPIPAPLEMPMMPGLAPAPIPVSTSVIAPAVAPAPESVLALGVPVSPVPAPTAVPIPAPLPTPVTPVPAIVPGATLDPTSNPINPPTPDPVPPTPIPPVPPIPPAPVPTPPIPIDPNGVSGGGAAAMNALNSLSNNPAFAAVLSTIQNLSAEQQQLALLQISPEFSVEVDILPKLQMLGLNRVVLDSAIVSSNNLTASSSSSIPTVKQGGIWTSAYGNWMKLNDTTDKRGSFLGYKSNTGGIAIGGHHQPNSQGLIGAFIGYGSGKTTNDIGMKATSDQYQGGVYAKYSPMKRGLFVSGLASYGYSNAKVNRAVNLGTMTDSISSKPKGNAMSSKLEIGYKIPAGNITIEPTGGIEYINRKTKAYSEISSLGTNLNLYMPARTNNNIVGSVGTKISANLGKTIPFLQVQYSSDLSSEKDYFYNINASFDAARDVIMSVQANMPKRNNLQITAGISSTFSYAHTFSISAASSISNNISNASASYAVRF